MSLLDYPSVYLSLQAAIGAKRARRISIEQFAKPQSGERVLDVGCGPGFVIEYLPDVDYVGTDIDERYIAHAKKQYSDRGEFHCLELNDRNAMQFGKFDLVLLNGVMHHIDDRGVVELLQLIRGCLHDSGRLLTLDGCYSDSMSGVSRFLLDHDRGQFVRTQSAYLELTTQVFPNVTSEHRKDLFRVPYDAIIMVCRPH